MTIRIRPATLDDIPAISAIYRPAVLTGTASFELDPPDTIEMRRRYEAITAARYPYVVAEDSGNVIGYAYASAFRARPAYRYTVEDSIYVAPAAQRSGIGSILLCELIALTTKAGFRQMIGVIGDSAQHASIAVHRKAGFEHIGTLPSIGYKHDRWLDIVLMQRRLGDGNTTPP